jgi:tetratricopeptide (TPR) repeat protein
MILKKSEGIAPQKWKRRLLGIGAAAIVATAWALWSWHLRQEIARELSSAERELAAGRPTAALKRLQPLAEANPNSSEVAYQVGLCEEKLGHLDRALIAWTSVGEQSPLYLKAAMGRALVWMNMGRYSEAEDVLTALPRDSGPFAGHVRHQLELLFRIEGRTQEARALIEKSWAGAIDPTDVVKRLFLLEDAPFPVDYVTAALKRGKPDDDRVRLGLANLATWQGHFDEARRLLDLRERTHPDDQPTWLARLSLATAAGDFDMARAAVERLRAKWFSPSEINGLRARFAAFRGDIEAERKLLVNSLEKEPGNTMGLARLAELALAAGKADEAARYRHKLSDVGSLRARYRSLLDGDQPARHVEELAGLARALGRDTEARGWALIRDKRTDEPLRAGDEAQTSEGGQKLLASLLGDVTAPPRGRSAPTSKASAVVSPRFRDDAEIAGLRFTQENGHTGGYRSPLETMCGGAALLDYNGDGWLDVFAVQGGPLPPIDPSLSPGDRLFQNRGDGTFEDVTERSGLSKLPRGYGNGVAVGDYDNDGRADLFVTRWDSYALYRNGGDGTFVDATAAAGLAGLRQWPTSAAFADLDNDGDLDLYVCHYLLYDPANPKLCDHPDSSAKNECLPRDFVALPDHVFRNDNGKFVDVTKEAGFTDPDGRGLGVVAADVDDDGKIDLYVANDMSPNYLFRNLGGFRFEEVGTTAGVAVSSDGVFKSGMGVACGDVDGDAQLDLAVTNFYGESTSLYRNLGHGLFADQTALFGLQAATRPLLGFGLGLADFNNDGWLDMLSTNGHVLDGRPRIPLQMPLQLLVGKEGKTFVDVSDQAGDAFRRAHLGRGLAIGDLDNDGRLDAVVVNQNEPLVYLHNQTEGRENYLTIRLEGVKSNRDGVGGRVTVRAEGRARIAERTAGGSYQSADDPRLHFGLGAAESVESVEIQWPSGQVDRVQSLSANKEYHFREGKLTLGNEEGPGRPAIAE